MDIKEFVVSTLTSTSEIAQNNFGKSTWTVKDDYNQVLTETDEKIGNFIIKRIQDVFPDQSIIDEEAGAIDKKSDYIWVVDPIDGTSNFAFGIPTYGTLLGLLHNNTPVAGGLVLPQFNKIYFAEKGKGVYCNGQKIQVTNETDLSRCLVSYSIDSNRKDQGAVNAECRLAAILINKIRSLRMNNSVFDAAMVLEGRYGAFMMKNSKIWDNVALQILVEEAGGIYSDFYGNPIDYSEPFDRINDNFTFLMAAPDIHTRLQEVIEEANNDL